jgi:nucleoside-diphosphate-sugar epimerase
MGSKIILTGSTGKLGSVILNNLLQLVPPSVDIKTLKTKESMYDKEISTTQKH